MPPSQKVMSNIHAVDIHWNHTFLQKKNYPAVGQQSGAVIRAVTSEQDSRGFKSPGLGSSGFFPQSKNAHEANCEN